MPNPLIFTIAVSEKYRTYASAMIRSLREVGCEAKIIVFCEQALEESGCDCFTLPLDAWFTHMGRYYITSWIETNGYDQIVYMDADTIAERNPKFLYRSGNWFLKCEQSVEDDSFASSAMGRDQYDKVLHERAIDPAIWSVSAENFEIFKRGVLSIPVAGEVDSFIWAGGALNAFLYSQVVNEGFRWTPYEFGTMATVKEKVPASLRHYARSHDALDSVIARTYPDIAERSRCR